MFIQLLLRSNGPIGEQIFIGALTGLIFAIILYFYNRKKEKRETKEYVKQIQQNIATESISIGTDTQIILSCYNTLYDELKEKCNPALFMDPYDAKKVDISNSIYSQLMGNDHNLSVLIPLRNQAIEKLGIAFSSQELYDKLLDIYNPHKYVGDNYSPEKLYAANKIYAQIQSKRDDIVGLEQIARECGIRLLDQNNRVNAKSYQELSSPPETIDSMINILIIIFLIFLVAIFLSFIVYAFN